MYVKLEVLLKFVHFMQSKTLWIPSLNLRHTEMDALKRKDSMLSDQHVYAVNELLIHQYPHLQGLHSTLLKQTSSGISSH